MQAPNVRRKIAEIRKLKSGTNVSYFLRSCRVKYNRRVSSVKKYKFQCSKKTKHCLRLLHIARKLTREDVECLRLVVGDIILRKIAKDIQSGLRLFQQLKWRGASVLNDYDQLR